MPDFKQLLSKPLDDVKRPPALPEGTYFGTIVGHKFGESRFVNDNTGDKDAIVTLMVRATHADDSVDAALLAAAEAAVPLARRQLSRDFPLTGGREYATKLMLESLGIETAGRTWDTTIPETTNASVMFEVTSRLDKQNPEISYNDIRNLRAAS